MTLSNTNWLKSGFAGESGAQAVKGIAGGVEDAFQAGLAFER